MINKYLKPKSLTWWSGFIPLVVGIFLASEEMHGLTALVNTINNITGAIPAVAMINFGLVAIGLRGKDG